MFSLTGACHPQAPSFNTLKQYEEQGYGDHSQRESLLQSLGLHLLFEDEIALGEKPYEELPNCYFSSPSLGLK